MSLRLKRFFPLLGEELNIKTTSKAMGLTVPVLLFSSLDMELGAHWRLPYYFHAAEDLGYFYLVCQERAAPCLV